jgi:hypothetical protein
MKLVECEGRRVVLTHRPQTRPEQSDRPESSIRMQPRPDTRDAIEAARRLPEQSCPPRCLNPPPLLGRQLPTEIVEHPLPNARQAIQPGVQVGLVLKSRLPVSPPWRAAVCLCMIASSPKRWRDARRGAHEGDRPDGSARDSSLRDGSVAASVRQQSRRVAVRPPHDCRSAGKAAAAGVYRRPSSQPRSSLLVIARSSSPGHRCSSRRQSWSMRLTGEWNRLLSWPET